MEFNFDYEDLKDRVDKAIVVFDSNEVKLEEKLRLYKELVGLLRKMKENLLSLKREVGDVHEV